MEEDILKAHLLGILVGNYCGGHDIIGVQMLETNRKTMEALIEFINEHYEPKK